MSGRNTHVPGKGGPPLALNLLWPFLDVTFFYEKGIDTGVSAVMGLVYDWPVFGDLLAQSFLALDMTTSASDHAFPPGSCPVSCLEMSALALQMPV